jgi:hypothetical protein
MLSVSPWTAGPQLSILSGWRPLSLYFCCAASPWSVFEVPRSHTPQGHMPRDAPVKARPVAQENYPRRLSVLPVCRLGNTIRILSAPLKNYGKNCSNYGALAMDAGYSLVWSMDLS